MDNYVFVFYNNICLFSSNIYFLLINELLLKSYFITARRALQCTDYFEEKKDFVTQIIFLKNVLIYMSNSIRLSYIIMYNIYL